MSFDDRRNRHAPRVEGQLRFYKTVTLILLAVVVVLAGMLIIGRGQRFARAIRIDGKLICLVQSQEAAEQVHARLLEEGKGDLPGEASLKEQWTDEPWPLDGHETLSISEAVEALKPHVTVLVDAYAITVDGVEMVSLPSEQFANDVLDAVKGRYVSEGDTLVEPQTFLEEVTIAPKRAKAEEVVTQIGKAVEILTQAKREAQIYTVKAGDYHEKIAADHGMSLAEYWELNPDLKGKIIHPGDKVKVSPEVHGITVETVKEMKETVEIEPEVERIATDSLARGETEVATEGVPGKKLITKHVTYHNDRKIEPAKVVETRIIEQPSPKRVLYGYVEEPAASGSDR